MAEVRLDVTDVAEGYDVCVVGGGMAGLCAALGAAREGARTIIIHDRPVFGGCGSTEMRVPFSGAGSHNPAANETGIILELITEERAASACPAGYGMVDASWDIILHDIVRREKNLAALLNTHVRNVSLEDDRILSAVGVQLGAERVWEVGAEFFIDATGDGALGVAAGVPFRVGPEARDEYGESMAPEEAGDWTLGSSLLFRARDVGRPVEFKPPAWAAEYHDEESLSHRGHRDIEGGYWWIEVGWPLETIRDDREIRDELLRHVLGVWDHIKNHCEHRGDAANHALDWIGMLPAKRESRRFIGAHVMTQDEIGRRERYADAVAYGGWIIDDHTKGGILERGAKPSFDGTTYARFFVSPYSVPLRSLHARAPGNLFFAGRVMSASRVAFNSLRVQRTLAVIGQAAGTAAAHCARAGRAPGELRAEDIRGVQQALLRQDCYIPGVRNEDPGDVARGAAVSASSCRLLEASAAREGLALGEGTAQVLPLSRWPERLRVYAANQTAAEIAFRGSLHRGADIWDLRALQQEPCATLEFTAPAAMRGPVTAELRGPAQEAGLFWLRLEPAGGLEWLFQDAPLPGLTAARLEGDAWVFAPGMFSTWRPFAADALPASEAFGPENVVNGIARPECWPNVWVSSGSAPQWLRLELARPARLARIQIAWGLDFHRSYFQMPALFRAPECARDYHIEVELEDGATVTWAREEGNYQRLRVHEAPRELAARVRAIVLTVETTNGAERVEVCEVRAYEEEGDGGP